MRKILSILVVVVVMILILVFLLPYFAKQQTGKDMTITESIKEFFPFGKPTENGGSFNNGVNGGGENTSSSTANNTSNNVAGTESEKKIPRLRQITVVPTAGAVTIEREREVTIGKIKKKIKEYFVRYMYRGNGHIEEIQTNSFDISKISNTTMPKVYEATFSNDGKAFIARFLGDNVDDIKTYSANLKPRIATSTPKNSTSTIESIRLTEEERRIEDVSGKYIDLNIREIAFSPSKINILSIFTSANGGSIVLSNTKGEGKKTLYQTPLREWLLSFPTESTAIISTKPSGLAYGFAYKLDTNNGSLTKIIGNIPGLTLLSSRDLQYALLGTGNNTLSVSIVKMDAPETPIQIINTIPEKCVWAKKDSSAVYCAVPKSIPRGTYPDDWYKGNVSFSDDIWKINVKTGFSNLLFSPEKEVGKEIDAVNIDISIVDNYLTFINKKDLTLWGYDITNEVNTKIDFGISTSASSTPTQ